MGCKNTNYRKNKKNIIKYYSKLEDLKCRVIRTNDVIRIGFVICIKLRNATSTSLRILLLTRTSGGELSKNDYFCTTNKVT